MAGLERLEDGDLFEKIIGLKPGDHLCVFYDFSPEEQMPAIVAFVQEGLKRGERCVYVLDDLDIADVRSALANAGIDVSQCELDGALLLWSREQWRPPGPLDPIRKAAQVREIVDRALREGYVGVRFAVEMTWTLKPDLSTASIEEWESSSNKLLAGGPPVRAMCLYGKRRFSQQVLEAAVRTHPAVLDEHGLRQSESFRIPV